jgi:hypothetical protein
LAARSSPVTDFPLISSKLKPRHRPGLFCLVATSLRRLLWVKLRNTQHEQMTSALPLRTDIGLDTQNIMRIECYGMLMPGSPSRQ